MCRDLTKSTWIIVVLIWDTMIAINVHHCSTIYLSPIYLSIFYSCSMSFISIDSCPCTISLSSVIISYLVSSRTCKSSLYYLSIYLPSTYLSIYLLLASLSVVSIGSCSCIISLSSVTISCLVSSTLCLQLLCYLSIYLLLLHVSIDSCPWSISLSSVTISCLVSNSVAIL